MSPNNKKGYRSIATSLLTTVFLFYIIITILIALFQMFMEYQHHKQNIQQDLEDIQRAYQNEFALDLWALNQESLLSSLKGILENPIVKGISIEDINGRFLANGGIVQIGDSVGYVGVHVNILGLSENDTSVQRKYPMEIFKHHFKLNYYYENKLVELGSVTIFSNTSVILRRITYGYILTIITMIIKITILWLIFLWFFTNLLKKPLEALTNETRKITLDNLKYFHVKIETKHRNELKILEESFNHMIENLNRSIDDREMAQKEVQHLRNYLSNIIDSMPSIIIGVDSQGFVTQWNLAAEELTQRKASEVKGLSLPLVFPELASEMLKIKVSIGNREIIRELNKRRITERGNSYVNITIYPLVTNGEKGAVIRIDDVTKEFELEEKIRQSQKMDAIGQLAGGIAHDFNNMLTGISSAAQLIKSDLSVNKVDDLEDYIDMIDKSATRAADLTSNLLAFGRKGSGSFVLLDIHDILADSIAFLKRTTDKRVEIIVEYNAHSHFLMGNAASLQNIFLNLGINASHAMPKGGVLLISSNNTTLNEEFCSSSTFDIVPGDYIELNVKDTGSGIPQENLSKIFEPFFSTKDHGKGSGLGLSASYGTVIKHCGAIFVTSEEEVGTAFQIFLPVTQDSRL